MKIIKTLSLIILICFFLGCTKKNKADIEDIWKPVDYFDKLLGEWVTNINWLDGENEITIKISYSIDENKNCIASLIEDYEPMVDKMCESNKDLKDIAWEMLSEIVSEKYEIPEDWERIKFSKGKYFTKITYIYFYQKDRKKKLEENIFLNQYGNKMKLSEDSFFVSELDISSDIIYEKVIKSQKKLN